MKNQYFPFRTLPKPSATFPELSGSATELPGASQDCFWTRLGTLDSGLPDRLASKLVPGDFQQHNHHKIITRSLRILIETLLKPPATFPDISGSATELPGAFQKCFCTLLRTPDIRLWTLDSGLQTPYSRLPIETRSLQEIIIKNHKPKPFSSSVEHPHKDSAWFTKSQN